MQTIKIYYKESGSIAELVKNFNLYVGSYQNKLLQVYVPVDVFYDNNQSLFVNAVKVGGILTATNGSIITTRPYYLEYVGNEKVHNDITHEDIEYRVFERLLPKEFVVYSGNQTIELNVVSIDDTDSENPKVLQIATTQTAKLPIQDGAYLGDEFVEPSEIEVVEGRLDQIQVDITELETRLVSAEANIDTNTQDIASNRDRIVALEEQYTQPEDYIGQMGGTMLPTQEQLTQYVIDVEGRQPKNADVVIFILQIEGETDKNYKYVYSKSGWKGYEIPPMETAKNGELGLVEGTYNIGLDYNTIVDISGGQIVNIYIKDDAGIYRNIQEYANTLNTSVANIINGKTQVGNALKSLQDGNGNNIVETYLTKNLGATKDYVQNYALPKQFNDVSYITDGGYSENIPSVSFSATSSEVGSTQLFDIKKTAGAKYQISNKNSYDNVVFINASKDCVVEFRLTTKIKGEIANIEVNDNVSLTAGGISRITFHDTFDYLNEDVLNVEENDEIEQILEVITSTSDAITFTIYSNSIYPSKFYLNTQSMIIKTVQGTIGEQLILGADGVLEENVYNFIVDSADAYMPYRKNGTKFLVDLHLPIVGELDTTKEVAITFGDTVYFVYNILKGQDRSTIGDLKQVDKYSNQTGYRFITEMTFFENPDITGFAIIPTISMSDVLALNSDEMDNYVTDGGLTQGQLAICSKVITNGYNEGSLYRFDITYPDTYQWTELSGKASGGTITNVNDTVTVEDFEGFVNLSDEQYSELVKNGTITIDGQTLTYNDNTVYVTPDRSIDVGKIETSIQSLNTRTENIEVSLTELAPDIARALKIPMSAPNELKLIGVNTGNNQEMLSIGEGLSIENGEIKATGGNNSAKYCHNIDIYRVLGEEEFYISFQIINNVSTPYTSGLELWNYLSSLDNNLKIIASGRTITSEFDSEGNANARIGRIIFNIRANYNNTFAMDIYDLTSPNQSQNYYVPFSEVTVKDIIT